MNPETINIPQLVADLRRLASESKQLKLVLRQTWTRHLGDEQRALHSLRRRTTELCILRARLRGRFHLQAPPRSIRDAGLDWDQEQFHAQIAVRVAEEYRLESIHHVRP